MMRGPANVPTEILNSILEYLYFIDLKTLIILQRTSHRFRVIAQGILSRQFSPSKKEPNLDFIQQPSSLPRAVDGLLWREFRPLFTASECFTLEERNRIIYLTIEGDNTLPFKRLPWARDERSREAYLRPEASWRNLSILQAGQEPITRLDIIRSYGTEDSDSVEYLRAVLPDGILTMGLLYDILLSEHVHFGDETGEWELMLYRRLRNHDLMQEYECFVRDDDDILDRGPGARRSAILYVQGAVTCDEPESWSSGHDWEPTPLGKPLKFLSWDDASKES